MPAAAVQSRLSSRISAFESLAAASSSSPSFSPSAKPPFTSPPRRGRDTLLETPLSPTTAAALPPVVAFTPPRPTTKKLSPSPSPPNLGRKTSLIDLKDWVVDDDLTNGHIQSSRTPTQQLFNGKGNGKRFSESRDGPLISLNSPPRPNPRPKPPALSSTNRKAPPLPPRKPSYTSLKSFASSSSLQSHSPPSTFLYPLRRNDSLTVDHPHIYPPDQNSRSRNNAGHAQASSISSFHSVSLSSDTDPSTPGSVTNFIATFPVDQDHRSPTTISARETDSISLTESYEDISAPSLASPSTERMITLDWEKAMAKQKRVPPKLPQRPPSTTSNKSTLASPPPHPPPPSSSNSHSTPSSPSVKPSSLSSNPIATYAVRRNAPPPPPSRSSDRSSIQSIVTSYSTASSSQSRGTSSVVHIKLKRPTPVPPGARKRYEIVFNGNVLQKRVADRQKQEEKLALLSPAEARGRRAAGWRGLSVDLITNDDPLAQQSGQDPDKRDDWADVAIGGDEKLDGVIVQMIWSRSGLDRTRLFEFW
jgi:hypothetical protein